MIIASIMLIINTCRDLEGPSLVHCHLEVLGMHANADITIRTSRKLINCLTASKSNSLR